MKKQELFFVSVGTTMKTIGFVSVLLGGVSFVLFKLFIWFFVDYLESIPYDEQVDQKFHNYFVFVPILIGNVLAVVGEIIIWIQKKP